MLNRLKQVDIFDVSFGGGFWGRWEDVMEHNAVMHQFSALKGQAGEMKTDGYIDNFLNFLNKTKEEFKGNFFSDSDIYKVIEFAANVIERTGNKQIEAQVDEFVDIIGAVQEQCGYVDTYYQFKTEETRWTNLFDNHELYCAGHLIEAGVAYIKATGKSKLLDIAIRFADHIDTLWGWDEGKKRGRCGHPEIELALVRLYEITNEDKYLRLSKYFIDVRGTDDYFKDEWMLREGIESSDRSFKCGYNQSHLPVRVQKQAVSHAVRAGYL